MGFGRVVRRRAGGIEVRLRGEERDVLRAVLGQLRAAIEADAEDPALRRLFPPAYEDDAEKEAGYRALAQHELLESRLQAIDAVEASLDAKRLDEDAAAAWMRSLNALRLVLGTRLDVTEEDDHDIDPSDPDAPAWYLYFFLSGLVDDLVGALSD
jgi:hypothetical protein